jgi:Ca2+-binding EF-hand superfamily protein
MMIVVNSISAAEFVRALTAANLYLSEAEMNSLMAPYRLSNLPNIVDYTLFQKAMNNVLTEAEALSTFAPWQPEEDNEVKHQTEDQLRVAAIVDQIAKLQYTRRIHLKPAFQDFDRARNGYVPSLRICQPPRVHHHNVVVD